MFINGVVGTVRDVGVTYFDRSKIFHSGSARCHFSQAGGGTWNLDKQLQCKLRAKALRDTGNAEILNSELSVLDCECWNTNPVPYIEQVGSFGHPE